jgi:hypothetical protein
MPICNGERKRRRDDDALRVKLSDRELGPDRRIARANQEGVAQLER